MNKSIKSVKDKSNILLIINDVRCIVQSYRGDDFVNLSPIQTGRELVQDRLDNIRIDLVNHHISTEGKENVKWKDFVSVLDIDEINNTLKISLGANHPRG